MLAKRLDALSFEIQESPVLYSHNGQIITSKNYKVISRSDNGEEISTMKNSYLPMYNSHFTESTERMAEISGFKIEGYSELDGGRIIFSHLKNTIEDFRIGGNKIDDYLLLGSSFDGRFPFFIGTTTNFIRCQNQFSQISKVEKIRHTKSAPKRVDELLRSLEIYFQTRQTMYENFERMGNVKIDEATKQLAMDYVLQISKEDRLAGEISTRKLNQLGVLNNSVITEFNDLGQNLFGLFNGVTRYTTHELNIKERSFGNIFGTAAEINKKAYNHSLELMLS